MAVEENPTIQRLEDQIKWYDRKSNSNQRWFHWLKVAEVIIAAFIPFLAGIGAPSILTGSAGVLIITLEGLQHLFQFHHNWLTYRSTCESLKHEKYLWLAKAGPYSDPENPAQILAERVEGLVSQEHTKWVSGQKRAVQTKCLPITFIFCGGEPAKRPVSPPPFFCFALSRKISPAKCFRTLYNIYDTFTFNIFIA